MDPKTDPKRYQKSLKIEVGKRERNMFQNGGQRGPKKEPKSIKIASNFDVETQAEKMSLSPVLARRATPPGGGPAVSQVYIYIYI